MLCYQQAAVVIVVVAAMVVACCKCYKQAVLRVTVQNEVVACRLRPLSCHIMNSILLPYMWTSCRPFVGLFLCTLVCCGAAPLTRVCVWAEQLFISIKGSCLLCVPLACQWHFCKQLARS